MVFLRISPKRLICRFIVDLLFNRGLFVLEKENPEFRCLDNLNCFKDMGMFIISHYRCKSGY